jgi:arginyl-tRNA synthetase
MSHVIGNAIANVHEAEGAEVKRNSYQGDVGMHIAKVVWAIWKDKDSMKPFPDDRKSPQEKANYLGTKYTFGDKMYDPNDKAGFSEGKEQNQKEIEKINKKIYEESDLGINKIYKKACRWSLESYRELYDRLGVDLDWQFFESETAPVGKQIVLDGLRDNIFEESENAVVYPGEKYGLHTRVFINSEGIPTYEAKDLGLMKVKYNAYQYDEAIVFTANEQNEYFEVVLDAAKKALPEIGDKTTHIGHGILQLPSGKMSSRTGDILSAEKLLDLVHEKAMKKISGRIDGGLEDEAAEDIAQAAVRYSILKQDIGKDITFDPDQALSFEGNSGPYLQYTHARAHSLLQEAGVTADDLKQIDTFPDEQPEVARLLYRFPEVVEHSARDYAPRYIANYLYQVGQSFNTFYGNTKIINEDEQEDYRLALTAATAQVLENGLKLLGIEATKEM